MSSAQRLLIDAGNTRLKWRVESAGQCVDQGSLAHRDVADWPDQLRVSARIDAVWIGSVAGAAVDRQLAARVADQSTAPVVFVRVERERLGLHVGYDDLRRLGVDRYLAMLGAQALHAGVPLCVVDAGTAITLDAVDGAGQHHGGLIAPGPRTMIASLLDGTARINDASRDGPPTPFARDTAEAVTGGAMFACAALVDRFVDDFSAVIEQPATLLMTGGEAGRITRRLRTMSVHAPDLVFAGLRALADAHS